jgi:hypothetical protein
MTPKKSLKQLKRIILGIKVKRWSMNHPLPKVKTKRVRKMMKEILHKQSTMLRS